jgi:hypothetical protein
LEAIAYGRDRDVKPADRLKAAELLAAQGASPGVAELVAEVLDWTPEELAIESDQMAAASLAELLSLPAGERRDRFPVLAVAVETYVEARIREAAGAPLTADEYAALDDEELEPGPTPADGALDGHESPWQPERDPEPTFADAGGESANQGPLTATPSKLVRAPAPGRERDVVATAAGEAEGPACDTFLGHPGACVWTADWAVRW